MAWPCGPNRSEWQGNAPILATAPPLGLPSLAWDPLPSVAGSLLALCSSALHQEGCAQVHAQQDSSGNGGWGLHRGWEGKGVQAMRPSQLLMLKKQVPPSSCRHPRAPCPDPSLLQQRCLNCKPRASLGLRDVCCGIPCRQQEQLAGAAGRSEEGRIKAKQTGWFSPVAPCPWQSEQLMMTLSRQRLVSWPRGASRIPGL